MNQVKDEFLSTYDKVFNKDGSIKPCGRRLTSQLIELAQGLKSGIDFGSNKTGVMNVVNIKALYSELK